MTFSPTAAFGSFTAQLSLAFSWEALSRRPLASAIQRPRAAGAPAPAPYRSFSPTGSWAPSFMTVICSEMHLVLGAPRKDAAAGFALERP